MEGGGSGKYKEDGGKVALYCQAVEKPDPAKAQPRLWQEGTLPGDPSPFVPEGGTGKHRPHLQGEALEWACKDTQGRAGWQLGGFIDSRANYSNRPEKGLFGDSAEDARHKLKQNRFWSDTKRNQPLDGHGG